MNKLGRFAILIALAVAAISGEVSAYTPVTPTTGGGTGRSLPSMAKVASQLMSALPRTNIPIAPLGDSITFGSTGVNNGVYTFGITSYINNAIAASGGKYVMVANLGVAGQTCAQMLARINTVIASGALVSPLMCGTNDLPFIQSGAETYASVMNTMEQIIGTELQAGILPVLVTTPPNNTNPVVAKRLQWFEYQLANYYGIPLIDDYKILVDPSSSSSNGGKYISADSSDGTHPNTVGIAAIEPTVITVLENIWAPATYPYLGSVSETASPVAEPSNLVRNGNFDDGTLGSPNFWTLNGSACSYSGSAAAAYPYTGNTLQCAQASPGGAFAAQGSGPNVGSSSPVSVGDTVYVAARAVISGLTPATASGCDIIFNNASGGGNADLKSVYNNDETFAYTYIVPSGTTSIGPQFFEQDAGTYTLNNFTIVDVTKQNAIWQPGQQGF